ncbi:hypothetical protein BDK51DRAFT_39532 [Blyttiomyces helicus]|uniref:Uncharacterized protein n=1 Tax=Blyttiomyces helicus TaxID=388810 RepID=A0A4P9WAD8_9FUNG|nr:hypothetical protein BDK51DRAFT_39532 [Blyttiomyces helicus]|eukprot:RKO88473.1 hypothetical protein BDK51DRAFT_39532 [Blyttiomyces helicus]
MTIAPLHGFPLRQHIAVEKDPGLCPLRDEDGVIQPPPTEPENCFEIAASAIASDALIPLPPIPTLLEQIPCQAFPRSKCPSPAAALSFLGLSSLHVTPLAQPPNYILGSNREPSREGGALRDDHLPSREGGAFERPRSSPPSSGVPPTADPELAATTGALLSTQGVRPICPSDHPTCHHIVFEQSVELLAYGTRSLIADPNSSNQGGTSCGASARSSVAEAALLKQSISDTRAANQKQPCQRSGEACIEGGSPSALALPGQMANRTGGSVGETEFCGMVFGLFLMVPIAAC